MAGNYEKAKGAAMQYQDIFGRGNFYLEIQNQGLEEEHKIQTDLFRLEKELNIPLVLTNDSHYLCGEDSHAHDVMLCVQTGREDSRRRSLPLRLRSILRQVRRRDGADFSRFAGRDADDDGDCRAMQLQAACG